MSDIIVSHYGIHHDADGLAHLVQGRGSTNAKGSKKRSPFVVRLPSGLVHCNIQVALTVPVPHDSHWSVLARLATDPLVQAMLPIPKRGDGVFFLDRPNRDEDRLLTLLILLSKLSSPIDKVVVPFGPKLRWDRLLENNNLQPVVVDRIRTTDRLAVADVAARAAASPRTLVLVGDREAAPSGAEIIDTRILDEDLDLLLLLPWESLGATVVRKFMRGELELPGLKP